MKARVRILRSDPKTGRKARYATYTVPVSPGDKVLGALVYIYEHLDPCLSFRFNCRGRHCGECAMTINGTPGLACAVAMPKEATIEPLGNLPLVKDLVIDRNGVYRSVLAHLPRPEDRAAGELRPVPTEVMDRIVRIDECIQCLCCMAVCPVYKKEREVFPGPMGLAALAALVDGRRCGGEEKAAMCIGCGLCEKVCPRRIPLLSEAIARLKGS